MDFIKFIVAILFAFNVSIISCGLSYGLAIKLWEEKRTVCGFNITEIPDPIKEELLKRNNTTTKNSTVISSDKIVVSYRNFKCCLKKVWPDNLDEEKHKLWCVESLLRCFEKTQESLCVLTTKNYLEEAFSSGLVFTAWFINMYIFIGTGLYIYHVCVQAALARRRGREREANRELYTGLV